MTALRGLIALLLLAIWTSGVGGQGPPLPPLRVHFIDVGQGDAVLIQSPSGQNVVYDAGEHPTRVRDYLTGLGVSHLGVAIASHNHADHIGGLAEVVKHFRPQFYMDNGVPTTTQTYARLQEAVAVVGSQLLEPTARRITLGEAALTIVPPPGIPDWDQNDNSIGVVLNYGAFRLSLAGDAEPREWAWWRTHAPDWLRPVHVHKASHHGSTNGDTTEGVSMLAPKLVVIGVGIGNTYGHPDQAALQLYANAAQVFRTDHHGTVIVEAQASGGYSVSVERGEGAKALPPPQSCVDINRAGLVELQEIIHIGPDRAQQIIDLRRVQSFRSVDDLIRVNGIGPARLADIKAQGKACVLLGYAGRRVAPWIMVSAAETYLADARADRQRSRGSWLLHSRPSETEC